MNTFQINAYKSIKSPKVDSTIPITDWFTLIKNSSYSDLITKARLGNLDYDKTKGSLPCVTYNFVFDGYKTNENIITSTGLIYIDIDNPTFDINKLDTSKVHSYYRSFGGKGYAVLVKVSGVTLNNFDSTYASVTNELGLIEYVDIQAAKATQFNVLSFDSNIFINDNAYTFSSVVAPPSMVIRKKEKAYTLDRGAEYKPLRFDDANEIPVEGLYTVNWDGWDNIKCFMLRNPIGMNRNKMLLSYCANLVYLNPDITPKKTYDILETVNQKSCETPVEDRQLWRVVESIHKYHKDGTLKPIYFRKKRKIVFNPTAKLNKDEKLGVCRNENAKHKTELSKDKLYGIIESWDFPKYGSVTQRKVYGNFPISKKTVEKYWSQFRALVDMLNRPMKS